jgi:hypothetical protein
MIIEAGAPHTIFLLDRLLAASFTRAAKILPGAGVNWVEVCTVLTDFRCRMVSTPVGRLTTK